MNERMMKVHDEVFGALIQNAENPDFQFKFSYCETKDNDEDIVITGISTDSFILNESVACIIRVLKNHKEIMPKVIKTIINGVHGVNSRKED